MVPLLLSAPWWVRLPKKLVQTSWWGGLVPAHWWVELGLVPLVGRVVSRGVFIGGCLLRTTLSSLSAAGWSCVPTPLVVWTEASWHWSPQAVGGARSQCQNGDLRESSR